MLTGISGSNTPGERLMTCGPSSAFFCGSLTMPAVWRRCVSAGAGLDGDGWMTGSGFIRLTPSRHARRSPRAAYATRDSRTSRGLETDARRPAPSACPDARQSRPAGAVIISLEPVEQRAWPRRSSCPLTLSVISDADAFEIAQPDPWKLTSAITPCRRRRYTVRRSPHSGLNPSALRPPSITRKFRGRRLWSRITSW